MLVKVQILNTKNRLPIRKGDINMTRDPELDDDIIQEPNTGGTQEPNTGVIQEPNTKVVDETEVDDIQEPNTK